jgi:hypothetical protein
MNVIRNACIEKDKINKKCGNRHQTFKKKLSANEGPPQVSGQKSRISRSLK